MLSTATLAALLCTTAQAEPTLLLRQPTVSAEHIAFAYAGDIWLARRDGSQPRRLTVHPAVESDPQLSPDGGLLAFTGHYDGNVDVYLLPVEGGQPTRLTFHPGDDEVRGWTPDGSQVVFRSRRLSQARKYGRLFTVSAEGGWPQALPMPMAEDLSYAPQGGALAYTPLTPAVTWKRYRGGQTSPIRIFDLASYAVQEVQRDNSNDLDPVWVGEELWFRSDRAGVRNVFMRHADGRVEQVTQHQEFDVKGLAVGGPAGAELLVYEQAGRLHSLDPRSRQTAPLQIELQPDLPHSRSHFADVQDSITSMHISPSGARAAFGARGEIFTVPAEKGDIRNLSRSPGVHDRFPAWSPDGQQLASLSDASGEYALELRGQDGLGEADRVSLGDASFYYQPLWSPDGEKLAYTDKRLNLWVLDLDKRQPALVASEPYDHYQRSLDPAWSPDGRWLAYTRRLANHLRALFVYDTEKGESLQVTDGRGDAISASFSRDGALLFFAGSTDQGLNTAWLDMSSLERPMTRDLYAVVLAADGASPIAPQSDEEPAAEEDEDKGRKKRRKGKDKEEEEEQEIEVRIDAQGIQRRIVALPVPAGDYHGLQNAAEGRLFYLERGEDAAVLHCYDAEEREAEVFLEGVDEYVISADGEKLLYASSQGDYAIVGTDAAPEDGDGQLDLGAMRLRVNPRAEWAQIYDEVLRLQRDWFYDPDLHGIDWQAVGERYRPWLAHLGHRADLQYLLGELIGELVVGHAYRWGGDQPQADWVSVGMLGADFELQRGRYRISRIYDGESWNPGLRAPLAQPGVQISEGDWILAVDGQPLEGSDNIYAFFQGRSGLRTVLTVNDRPSEAGARQVTVIPVDKEDGLRHRAWVEGNRRLVDELSGGRAAYVYVPNTAWDGYRSFNRYFYSQLDKQAVVVDERFNGGGMVADYLVDMLAREPVNYNATREGADYPSPLGVIPGPRVMLINEYAGSGGDCLPHYFRQRGLGKLVGTRTWGGLVGIYDYPPLIDGGVVTAPRIAFYGPQGWTAENVGVSPDIEVEMTPAEVIAGHDPQLEKAVEVVLEELEKAPFVPPKRPEYPDYGE